MGNSKTIWRTGKKWLINKGRKALACFGGGNVEEEDIPDLRSWPTINLVVEQELQCPQDRIDYELDNIAKVDESCEHVEVTNEEFIILPEQNVDLSRTLSTSSLNPTTILLKSTSSHQSQFHSKSIILNTQVCYKSLLKRQETCLAPVTNRLLR